MRGWAGNKWVATQRALLNELGLREQLTALRPEFGATFASSQVDGIAREKCFHYA
jgi:hypothetical protein